MRRRRTTTCLVPRQADGAELRFYRLLLGAHCDRKDEREAHECRGKITVEANSVLLQCPVCGDAKIGLTPSRDIE